MSDDSDILEHPLAEKDPTGPMTSALLTTIRLFEGVIVFGLILMMMVAIAVSAVELGIILYQELMRPPKYLLNIEEMLAVFGFFMMVLIGLELLETIKTYLEDRVLHVEVVLLVAVIAMARKVIILDLKDYPPLMLVGIGITMLALAGAYALVRGSVVKFSGHQRGD